MDANSCINAFTQNFTELLCQSWEIINCLCLSPIGLFSTYLYTLISILSINAFIYAVKYREFRQGVGRMISELAQILQQTQLEIPVEMENTPGTAIQSTDV